MNLWWMPNFLIWVKNLGNSASNYGISLSWLNFSSPAFFWKVFRNLGYWPWEFKDYVLFQGIYYSSNIHILVSYIPLIIALLAFRIKSKNIYLNYFRLSFLIIFFFVMGPHFPILGHLFVFLYKNAPFFNTFQNTYYKFSWIYVMSFAFLLGFFLYSIRAKQNFNRVLMLLFACLLFLMGPYMVGKWIVQESAYGSMSVKEIPKAYYDVNQKLNTYESTGRVVTYPQSKYNYYYDWGTYLAEITHRIFDKPQLFISPVGYMFGDGYAKLVDRIYKSRETIDNPEQLANILSLLHVQYIFLDNTVRDVELNVKPEFILNSVRKNPSFKEVYYQPYKSPTYKELDGWRIYKISNDYYLPMVYVPSGIIKTNQPISSIRGMIDKKEYKVGTLIYFKHGLENKWSEVQKLDREIKNKPVIEYKKINPTKYRVVIHKANGTFPLVIGESYHSGWHIYQEQYSVSRKSNNSSIQKITSNDSEDKVTNEDLNNMVKEGVISDIVYKNNIDYISKNFAGSIQNNNLTNGSVSENWFNKKIDSDSSHLLANGYANSWIIDTEKLCEQGNRCVKNPDGTYDLELAAEFVPQHYFYFGLIVSGGMLVLSLGYLAFTKKKQDRKR